jgi:hypothetical protein
MKIVFQAQAVLTEIATDAFVAEATRPGTVFFRPLSAPGVYEDRIDITIKSGPSQRTYPYKRADESVN